MISSARNSTLTSFAFAKKNLANSILVNKLVRSANRLPSFFGFKLSFSRYLATIFFYSKSKDKKLYAAYKDNDIFVNFGSGGFQHKRWICYDYPGNSKYYKSLQGAKGKNYYGIDLTDCAALPFEDESVALIYCSHTLEHLPEKDARFFLSECARILKVGGGLRLALPDTTFDIMKAKIIYEQNRAEDALCAVRDAASHIFAPSASLMDVEIQEIAKRVDFDAKNFSLELINRDPMRGAFRDGNPEFHLSFWSHEKLLSIGLEVGFNMYVPSQQGVSTFLPFTNRCVFDTTEPQLSLYGELLK